DPTSLPAFLAQHQAITLPTDDTDRTWLQRLSGALGSEPARRGSHLAADEPPFPGLAAFRPQHAPLFLRRDRAAAALRDRTHDGRGLAVVGASGRGRWSVVQAGLVPGLYRGRFHESGAWRTQWRIATCRPADNPFRELSAALADLADELSPDERIRVIAQTKA